MTQAHFRTAIEKRQRVKMTGFALVIDSLASSLDKYNARRFDLQILVPSWRPLDSSCHKHWPASPLINWYQAQPTNFKRKCQHGRNWEPKQCVNHLLLLHTEQLKRRNISLSHHGKLHSPLNPCNCLRPISQSFKHTTNLSGNRTAPRLV